LRASTLGRYRRPPSTAYAPPAPHGRPKPPRQDGIRLSSTRPEQQHPALGAEEDGRGAGGRPHPGAGGWNGRGPPSPDRARRAQIWAGRPAPPRRQLRPPSTVAVNPAPSPSSSATSPPSPAPSPSLGSHGSPAAAVGFTRAPTGMRLVEMPAAGGAGGDGTGLGRRRGLGDTVIWPDLLRCITLIQWI
jgi:hypothetical protein